MISPTCLENCIYSWDDTVLQIPSVVRMYDIHYVIFDTLNSQ